MTRAINRDLRPFGFAYDPRNDLFYTKLRPWMQEGGRPASSQKKSRTRQITTVETNIPFEHSGKKWTLQMRMGQYAVFTGAEVSLYAAANGGADYASLPKQDFPYLALSLWKDDSLLFCRSAKHWWLTGFLLGTFAHPNELTMHVDIRFRDEGICLALKRGLAKTGYPMEDFQIRGRDVRFIYRAAKEKPNAKKRTSPNPLRQMAPRLQVFFYQLAANKERTPLQRLMDVKRRFPWLYAIILHALDEMRHYFKQNRVPQRIKQRNAKARGEL